VFGHPFGLARGAISTARCAAAFVRCSYGKCRPYDRSRPPSAVRRLAAVPASRAPFTRSSPRGVCWQCPPRRRRRTTPPFRHARTHPSTTGCRVCRDLAPPYTARCIATPGRATHQALHIFGRAPRPMHSIPAYMRICTCSALLRMCVHRLPALRVLYLSSARDIRLATSVTADSCLLLLPRPPSCAHPPYLVSLLCPLARAQSHCSPHSESRIRSISVAHPIQSPPNLHPQNARPQFPPPGCGGNAGIVLVCGAAAAPSARPQIPPPTRLFVLGGRLAFLCLFCPLNCERYRFLPGSGWNARGLRAGATNWDFPSNTCCWAGSCHRRTSVVRTLSLLGGHWARSAHAVFRPASDRVCIASAKSSSGDACRIPHSVHCRGGSTLCRFDGWERGHRGHYARSPARSPRRPGDPPELLAGTYAARALATGIPSSPQKGALGLLQNPNAAAQAIVVPSRSSVDVPELGGSGPTAPWKTGNTARHKQWLRGAHYS